MEMMMDRAGFEPATSCVQDKRSTIGAIGPSQLREVNLKSQIIITARAGL